jgi:hypothetical protein
METKIAIRKIWLNTQDFSSVRLPTECMTYSQRYSDTLYEESTVDCTQM